MKNTILVINAGSTSIKIRLFSVSGLKEVFKWSKSGLKPQKKHHNKAFSELFKLLEKKNLLDGITAYGHRVVHGGDLNKSIKVGKRELKTINKFSHLAPLHNPYNLNGINTANSWKKLPSVAVFDTAFFGTIPPQAYTYAISASVSKKYKLRKYGFHGTSHNYTMLETAKKLGKSYNKLNLITVHLGGGCSITAIKKGKAIDTSMGFTPLEGLVMGTRSGDIDAGLLIYLASKKWSWKKIEQLLVHKSGLLGLSGTSDMLKFLSILKKNKKAQDAFKVYIYRIQKYIGAYLAALGKVDAISFTGSIGAGKPIIRNQIMAPLKKTILKKVSVFAISPNEEKMIAQETKKVLKI